MINSSLVHEDSDRDGRDASRRERGREQKVKWCAAGDKEAESAFRLIK